MADNGIKFFTAPLHDAKHRSAKREQGAHVRAQGCATKSAGTADLNAVGGPKRQRRASHRDVASSSRRPAWREKRRDVSATRRCRNRRAGRNGFGDFCRNKSHPLAAEAGGTKTKMLRTREKTK
jgi:hypothetical protein